MNTLLALVAAMAISMALIPVMVRFAPRLGLMDQPSLRKVHAAPVPRVGGVGIVVGALIPILFLLPSDKMSQAFIIGTLVLFVFGLWDDISEIGYYAKFLGQLIAVSIVVFYGDLYVITFPFVSGGEIPPLLGIPFTFVAMVGMINAINLSDGLDGLAGGESLFSLGAITFLAILMDGVVALTITLTVIGGIFGFLRYNTHPARVFMGDSGSQFLGYTLGYLAILLTQSVDRDLSPAVVLLLLGLPIVDSLVVIVNRVRSRISPFKARRDHIHHRLLDLGFVHHESVIIIYSLQMVLVTSGVILRYESNALIIAVYLMLCSGIFVMLRLAERSGWKTTDRKHSNEATKILTHDGFKRILVIVPRRFLSIGIPIYFIGTSVIVERVPSDFAKMSLLVAGLIALDMFFGSAPRSIIRRALIYIVAAFIGHLGISYTPDWLEFLEPAKTSFFILIAVAFAAAVKFSPRRRKAEFETTATDYLVVFCLVAVLMISKGNFWGSDGVMFVVQMVVIFYGCELLIMEKRGKWSGLSAAALVTAFILAFRGLLLT
ncbi:MAG: glycosyltransferase family 4 protein [Arenicellales bacterium]